ncbi:hypothetical protein P22_0083 [Propionispora sp. 2/2-37]|uniref:arsenate reductase family protein n=1 Tax=Propionispora sp. 2/2-37 TaxID=1677858 RepID=UPI0006BB8AA7|nr:ArsC/Spx/MgsR family protein [Propionispora sp. 2/2-37]CUH94021.1 hypothetical protein P22_0083 [Propionispora sp. 2/2-37]
MNIQIFGIKKCQNTRKAERFFKERGIKYQFIDLTVKGVSKGELRSISQRIRLDDLINKEGKEYQKMHLKYILHDITEVLLNNPLLFTTPIVRNGASATVGYQPEEWKTWK